MIWTVAVEDPDIDLGATCAMIAVTESSTNPKHGQDVLLLGVDDTERLIEALKLAVSFARIAEAAAKAHWEKK